MKRFALTIAILCAFSSSFAEAFEVPERLEYALKWTGLTAGFASLETTKEPNGNLKIVSIANSADWVSVFYPVEDRVTSIIESNSAFRSLNYRVLLREGRHRRNKEFIFNHSSKKVVLKDYLSNEESEFPMLNGIFDPLSAFYAVRRMNLIVGKSVFVPVFDSKKVWDVEVQVLKKEKIETALGVFDTILIRPIMKSEGIFSKKGELLIWLTDDDKKIPVLLKSKVAVGSINAELVGGRF